MKRALLFFIFLFTATLTTIGQIPTDGLIAYYPFNGTANDASGNENNGTVIGPTLTSDRFGNANSAYYFDGNNQYIRLIDKNGFSQLADPESIFTLTAWVKTTSTDQECIISNSSEDGWHSVGISNSHFYAHITNTSWGGSEIATTDAVNDGNWHFIVFVFSNPSMKIYSDSKFKGSADFIGNLLSSGGWQNGGVKIGAYYDNPIYFNGSMDDIRIYNRALSELEIQALYQEGDWTADPPNELVADYPFNENANDESGNGNNGTVNGATPTADRFGNPGKAYSFNGANNYIEIPHNQSLVPNQFSIQVWVKNNGSDEQYKHIVSKYYRDSYKMEGYVFQWRNDISSYLFSVSNGPIEDHHIEYPCASPGNWNHFVMTYDGNEAKLYANGVLAGTLAFKLKHSDMPLEIGRDYRSMHYFNGNIDDIRIYNKVLTESEIQALYHESGWGNGTIQLDAVLNKLEKGPQISNIEIPENGIGYIYFNFSTNGNEIFSTQTANVKLIKESSTIDATGYFVDKGIFRIAIPATYFNDYSSISFTLPSSIQISDTTYNIIGTPFTFTANKVPMKYQRTWDIFAEGSAGVSGSLGSWGIAATVAAAKLSVSGSSGTGISLELDQDNNLIIGRRGDLAISSSLELPSINTVSTTIKPQVGLTLSATVKYLWGQNYSFSNLAMDENKKKMAQSGFMLETISISGVSISPVVGLFIKGITNTLNSLGGVKATFDNALLNSYSGAGLEGTIKAGFSFEDDFFSLSGLNADASGALLYKHYNYYGNSADGIQGIAKGNEVIFAHNYNISALSFGLKLSDKVGLGADFGLFQEGAGEEATYKSYMDKDGNILGVKSIITGDRGDALFSSNQYTSYSTEIMYPEEYSSAIKSKFTDVAGLWNMGGSLKLPFENTIATNFTDLSNSLTTTPILINSYEVRGNRLNFDVGIDLETAFGAGLGVSLGFKLNAFDEVKYPKKVSAVYNGGYNYLLSTSDYYSDMNNAQLKSILVDMLNNTAPLIKEAFNNLLNKAEKVVAAGQQFIIQSLNSASASIGTISGKIQKAGKWVVSIFSPKTTQSMNIAFDSPIIREMYYAPEVYRRPLAKSRNSAMIQSKVNVLFVSDVMNIGFVADGTSSSMDSLEAPIDLQMNINKSLMAENGFQDTDKSRIKIYYYDKSVFGWVDNGGVLEGDSTVKSSVYKLGSYALGIELQNQTDTKAPLILDWGPKDNSENSGSFDIFVMVQDEKYGSGIDLVNSTIQLNGKNLDVSFDATTQKFYYTAKTDDENIKNSNTVIFTIYDNAQNKVEKTISFSYKTTDVSNKNEQSFDFRLDQNYPNPFNLETVISFVTPKQDQVTINIYDAVGRHIRTLYDGEVSIGQHNIKWDGKNDRGSVVNSGIYIYQFKSSSNNILKKMMLIK